MIKKKSNIGGGNKECLICKKKVDDMLFCNKCRNKGVLVRILAFRNSKYWK